MEPLSSEQLAETATEDMIRMIEEVGLAYIHSSGCAVLSNGTWLQPEQWGQWLAHLEEMEEGEC